MNIYDTRELDIRLSMLEQVSSERYEKLYALLDENRKELKELRQLASMGTGAWKAVIGLGIVLTLILTYLKISVLTHLKPQELL
jgi:hypothetical protein